MITFSSMLNPERSIHSRHAEAGLINPENNIERLNANQEPHSFGKIGTTETKEEQYKFGKYDPKDLLGRSMVITKSRPETQETESLGEGNDCNSLFSDEEISDILKKAGRPQTPPGVFTVFKDEPEFDAKLYDDRLVINNTSRTNDTTVIFEDGRAMHIGSFHQNQTAEKGECNGVVEEAKKRYFES